MSRGVFRSHNKVGETMTFQTNASSATTFDPRVSFGYGSDRVSWDVGDGSGYQVGNSLSYVYSDTGATKTVTLRTNRLLRLEAMDAEGRNIVGNLDLSGWVNLADGPTVNNYNQFGQNPQMTGITNPNSAVNGKIITHYNLYNSNITGVLDVSGLNAYKYFDVALNSNLTNVIFGNVTGSFTNRLWMYNCDLGYVNFLPLSGASVGVSSTNGIRILNNNMSVDEVNHILEDFDNISTNLNPAGWTGTTLDMGGTNAAPDGGSGGFNGLAALSSLTGATNNWTITTS